MTSDWKNFKEDIEALLGGVSPGVGESVTISQSPAVRASQNVRDQPEDTPFAGKRLDDRMSHDKRARFEELRQLELPLWQDVT